MTALMSPSKDSTQIIKTHTNSMMVSFGDLVVTSSAMARLYCCSANVFLCGGVRAEVPRHSYSELTEGRAGAETVSQVLLLLLLLVI